MKENTTVAKDDDCEEIKEIVIEEDGKYFRITDLRISDGKKEEVFFRLGFGWITADELWDLQQSCPNIAP